MLAAGRAGEFCEKVILLEKNARLGRKLLKSEKGAKNENTAFESQNDQLYHFDYCIYWLQNISLDLQRQIIIFVLCRKKNAQVEVKR